jgi:formate dehydrogenase major subunit
MEQLLSDHAAVLIAAGCYESNRLNVPGEDLPGVFSGLDFMIRVCSGEAVALGKKVLVIGAGFTAFDCARSALRLGAEEVVICLRRTEEDLTVTADEVFETKVENVKINSLMLSRRILGTDRVEGVEFVRSRPGELQGDGKRRIEPIEGSEFVVPAASIIVAAGQNPSGFQSPGKKDEQGRLMAEPASYRTSHPGLYVAGDYLTGPSTVIQAISRGRWAAERIAQDLTGKEFRQKVVRMRETDITDRQRAWDFLPREEMPTVKPVDERFRTFNLEVETGLNREEAQKESQRCYLCYLHYEIDIDHCIYCRYCIDAAPRDCIKLVEEIKTNESGAVTGFVETTNWNKVHAVVIDNSRCIRCGECMRVCPVDCISVTKVELVERLLQTGE